MSGSYGNVNQNWLRCYLPNQAVQALNNNACCIVSIADNVKHPVQVCCKKEVVCYEKKDCCDYDDCKYDDYSDDYSDYGCDKHDKDD